jgi:hypothetical protein
MSQKGGKPFKFPGTYARFYVFLAPFLRSFGRVT